MSAAMREVRDLIIERAERSWALRVRRMRMVSSRIWPAVMMRWWVSVVRRCRVGSSNASRWAEPWLHDRASSCSMKSLTIPIRNRRNSASDWAEAGPGAPNSSTHSVIKTPWACATQRRGAPPITGTR